MKTARQTSQAGIPEFHSLGEERAYWEARGPLAEDKPRRTRRSKAAPTRNSFLTVRLTGEELDRLRDIAARRGLGPSTYAQTVLIAAMAADSERSKPALTSRS